MPSRIRLRYEGEKKAVQIQALIKEAVKLIRITLPSTIEIKQDIDNNCRPILIDPTQIYQVLLNLCTNANFAMIEPGGILNISLKESEIDSEFIKNHPEMPPGKYICMCVKDSGRGMDKETLNHIFEPFLKQEPAQF